MIRLLLAILPFLKEVIFGRDRHDQRKPPMGKFKKFVIYALIVASFSLNYFLIKKTYSLTMGVLTLSKKADELDATKALLQQERHTNTVLAGILRDKVHADKLAQEAAVLEKEAKLLDKENKGAIRGKPPQMVPQISPPRPAQGPYEFRGTIPEKTVPPLKGEN